MVEIIPSILVKTYEEFQDKVKKVEPFVGRVHLDIADGIFVPNKTIQGWPELIKIDTNLKFDVHLMVQKPADEMHDWFKTRAERIIVHVETNHVLHSVIETAKFNEKKIGLALNPETQLESIEEFLDDIDFVHFMTVKPGFYGSPFMPEVVNKIAMFHEQHPQIPIMVDGDVNTKDASDLIIAGASMLVVGHDIFNSPDVGKEIHELEKFSGMGDSE